MTTARTRENAHPEAGGGPWGWVETDGKHTRITWAGEAARRVLDDAFTAEDRVAGLLAERDRLREALGKYGHHERSCERFDDPPATACTCGLTDALDTGEARRDEG